MAKVEPWHTTGAADRQVYHYDDQCTEGKQIAEQDHKPGRGDRKPCEQCMQLAGPPPSQ